MQEVPSDYSKVIRGARAILGLNQADFASEIGRSQSEVSKYESGLVAPPINIFIHCLNICQQVKCENDTSIRNIVDKLSERFDLPEHALARQLIMKIIEYELNK